MEKKEREREVRRGGWCRIRPTGFGSDIDFRSSEELGEKREPAHTHRERARLQPCTVGGSYIPFVPCVHVPAVHAEYIRVYSPESHCANLVVDITDDTRTWWDSFLSFSLSLISRVHFSLHFVLWFYIYCICGYLFIYIFMPCVCCGMKYNIYFYIITKGKNISIYCMFHNISPDRERGKGIGRLAVQQLLATAPSLPAWSGVDWRCVIALAFI